MLDGIDLHPPMNNAYREEECPTSESVRELDYSCFGESLAHTSPSVDETTALSK